MATHIHDYDVIVIKIPTSSHNADLAMSHIWFAFFTRRQRDARLIIYSYIVQCEWVNTAKTKSQNLRNFSFTEKQTLLYICLFRWMNRIAFCCCLLCVSPFAVVLILSRWITEMLAKLSHFAFMAQTVNFFFKYGIQGTRICAQYKRNSFVSTFILIVCRLVELYSKWGSVTPFTQKPKNCMRRRDFASTKYD